MSKTVLNDLVNLENQTSSVNTINANNAVIETAFDNTLSRNGLSPNQMESTLDMNSNRIINLPEAVSTTEPITLTQINTIIASGQIPNGLVSVGVPVSAAMQPVVNASTITSARALLFITGTPIEFYGGKADNSTDNSAALTAFYAANPNGGSVTFGVGKYKFNSAVTANFSGSVNSSYSLIGLGSENTIFSFPASDGLIVNYANEFQTVHILGITFETLSTIYTGITLTQLGAFGSGSQNTLDDVTFRGQVPSGSSYWSTAILVNSVSNINFSNIYVAGTYPHGIGVNLSGTASIFGVIYNFVNCSFLALSQGILYGGTAGYIQGVTVANCNFNALDFGIVSNPGVIGLSQLSVTTSQFAPLLGAGIYTTSPIRFTLVSGCLFLAGSNNSTSINFLNNQEFSITGNSFNGDSLTGCLGIFVGTTDSSLPSIITGNTFSALSIGVDLSATSNHVNIQSNVYSGVGTTISNAGTSNTLGGGSI